MVVVSDTSPLINLAAIQHLWLVPEIYGPVIIPQAVFNEIVVEGIGEPGADEIQSADWVSIKTCKPSPLLDKLQTDTVIGSLVMTNNDPNDSK